MAKQEESGAEYVFAQYNGTVHDKDGLPFNLVAGQPWIASDPLVKQNPDAFHLTPPSAYVGRSTTAGEVSA